MYSNLSSFVIAFHGCDLSAKNSLLQGEKPKPSLNKYDWLGSGFYCWEQNETRAMEFAQEAAYWKKMSKGIIVEPAVLGLVIDFGNCLNLLDSKHLERLKNTYMYISEAYKNNGLQLPANHGKPPDRVIRDLDCLVIEKLHAIREKIGERPFDTVRGMFPEGNPLYDNAGFRDKNHIQICVRNQNCIKAFFDPRVRVDKPFSWLKTF
jgi:hypothetical protein